MAHDYHHEIISLSPFLVESNGKMDASDQMNINDLLPPEILSMVFKYLSVKSKFNCIKVCKKWKAIILDLKLRNLVVAQDQLPVNGRWSFTFEQVDCRNSIINMNLNLIENQLKRQVFSSLRNLYIYTISLSYLTSKFVETLNELQLLERLELPLILLHKGKTIITLPNLQMLSIKQVHNGHLVLRTPKLTKLRLQSSCFDNLEFVYPEMMSNLVCSDYAKVINRLMNLEFLFCLSIVDVDEHLLLDLPNLKQVHFEHDPIAFYNLLNQKRILNRTDLKIYYQGLNNLEYLEKNLNYGSDALNENNIQIYLNNYKNTADQFIFIHYIDYNSWQTANDDDKNTIPVDFIEKFVNLDAVLITAKVNDEYKLIDFFNSCYNFSLLQLNYSSLRAEFYSQLPILCPTLRSLEIRDEEQVIEKLKFNFIFRLHHLNTLTTNKQIPVDFVYQVFRELKYFSTFSFNKLDDKMPIKIQFLTNLFEVSVGEEIYFFETLDDMYYSLKEFGL